MVIKPKQTTIAYRCPHCGSAVKSIVGVFSLNAEMLKIKCPCGNSEMIIKYAKDGKIRITVPCFICRTDHTYTVNESVIFSGEMFYLNCRYSGVDICFIGKEKEVQTEIDATLNELAEMLDSSAEELFGQTEEYPENSLPDPSELVGIILTVKELLADGHVSCYCDGEKGELLYREDDLLMTTGIYENNSPCSPELVISDNSLVLECKNCGGKYIFEKDVSAENFAKTDKIKLI